ncbi:protein of unknown function [Petrocella atlantisensis]|uniref:Uncharacterized protein n=1 Tax=Petrocella atlantisensis TaxID=2173034 RepID=A0A3P7PCT9_9FIRM|nr:protein of unknown function [Petrocella atlantisensis]
MVFYTIVDGVFCLKGTYIILNVKDKYQEKKLRFVMSYAHISERFDRKDL